MSRTDSAFVEERERGVQAARGGGRKEVAADRWNHLGCDEGVGIGDRGAEGGTVCPVRDIQLGSDQLVRQRDQSVAASRRVEDRLQLKIGVAGRP